MVDNAKWVTLERDIERLMKDHWHTLQEDHLIGGLISRARELTRAYVMKTPKIEMERPADEIRQHLDKALDGVVKLVKQVWK